jgi:hypothetical protein
MGLVRRFWLLGVLIFLTAIWAILGYSVPALTKSIVARLNASVAAAGWVLFLSQYLYHTSDRIFFTTNRLWLALANKSVRWTLKVSLEEIRAPVSLTEIVKVIRDSYGKEARVWQEDPSQAIINLPGWTLRISRGTRPEYGDIEARQEDFLMLEVTDLEVPFRESADRIGRRILPLIEKIVRMTDAGNPKYAAIIGFRGSNPYFGFFVRRVSLANIVDFQCEYFDLVGGERERVSVRKDRIELVSASLSGIGSLSLKYLALSPAVGAGSA